MDRTGTRIGSLHLVIGSHRDVDVEELVGTDVSILLQEDLLVVASIQEGPHAQYPTPSLARLCNIHEPRHDAFFYYQPRDGRMGPFVLLCQHICGLTHNFNILDYGEEQQFTIHKILL